MVVKDENEKGVMVPGLIISDSNGIRRFLRSIKRIKMRKERKIEFSTENFEVEKYTAVLKDYNMKMRYKKRS
jgi:hypothetical protein